MVDVMFQPKKGKPFLLSDTAAALTRISEIMADYLELQLTIHKEDQKYDQLLRESSELALEMQKMNLKNMKQDEELAELRQQVKKMALLSRKQDLEIETAKTDLSGGFG